MGERLLFLFFFKEAFLISTCGHGSTRLSFRLPILFCRLVPGSRSITLWGFLNSKKLFDDCSLHQDNRCLLLIGESCQTVSFSDAFGKNTVVHPNQFIFLVLNHLQQSLRLKQTFSSFMASCSQYLPS